MEKIEDYSVLVVDDDEKIVSLLVRFLTTNCFKATGARSAAEARVLVQNQIFHIGVIDCMMPEENGIEFVHYLRNSGVPSKDMPVIMLTAIDSIDNKLLGFENGIDDYVVKPFDQRELLARIDTFLKRRFVNAKVPEMFYFGDCSFDFERGELKKKDQVLYVSSTDVAILRLLCSNPNQAVSRREFSNKIGFTVSDRAIDVQITRLRKKIGDNAKQPNIIKTERYVGYSICLNNP